MANHWGIPVSERKISIDEVLAAHASGSLQEIFGSGTAAVISPVGDLKFEETVITISGGKVGPIAQKFFDAIVDIQYGRSPDPMGWVVPLD